MISLIIRQQDNHFVMIEQHEHAQFSGSLFHYLHEKFAPSIEYLHSISYAIFHHDCGWIPFDKAPFWNDELQSPYSFIHFPIAPKTVLYEQGINLVQEKDLYAALLCSEHYTRFLKHHSTDEAEAEEFMRKERTRQKKLKKELQSFDEQLFISHYEILQFFDNISLYVCLNEPGVAKEKEHTFFKHGIKLPTTFGGGKLQLYWVSTEEIIVNKSLFKSEITIALKQKVIAKKAIAMYGLQNAYDFAPYKNISVKINKVENR